MEKYFFLAPFSGTVVEVFTEPGGLAGPGVRVARIAKTGDYEVKLPVPVNQLDFYKKEGRVAFYSADQGKIGTGKLIRISDVINQRTQSLDVYYSLQVEQGQAVFNGMFLTAQLQQRSTTSSMAIPRMAVSNNMVQVLRNAAIEEKAIEVVGSKPDTLFVSGLSNGDLVVLEQQELERLGKKKIKAVKQ